ncbi:unnamed protein product [Protopolystoma xenopodis]|uniref:Uncharacterized protein n=1 Tax=Protopolystoma xenopodis TaxID=117903 RepID=A0A448WZ75_9PLAT|nr:unnamed protein product [Protopolystoma xenopodis]
MEQELIFGSLLDRLILLTLRLARDQKKKTVPLIFFLSRTCDGNIRASKWHDELLFHLSCREVTAEGAAADEDDDDDDEEEEEVVKSRLRGYRASSL